jgi:hypothetical protein
VRSCVPASKSVQFGLLLVAGNVDGCADTIVATNDDNKDQTAKAKGVCECLPQSREHSFSGLLQYVKFQFVTNCCKTP